MKVNESICGFRVYFASVDPRCWDDGVKFCTASCEDEAREFLGGHGVEICELDGPLCLPPARMLYAIGDDPSLDPPGFEGES